TAGRLNYVAMDLKTLPERYSELGWKGSGLKSADHLLKKTMSLLFNSGIDYEIRTTVVPPLVDEDILKTLSDLTETAPRWIWQPYNPGITLNPDWSNIKAPDEDDLRTMLGKFDSAKNIVIR
ncbi:MAG: hypothetical protein KAH21_02760, partial [Spirochaetaceae bacterium]|nr:hypothetical protein [Spirochaetaceae bacterium]